MGSKAIPAKTESAILARIIQSAEESELTPEIARYLLSMKLTESDEDRVNELSEKARAGELTPEETHELEGYIHIGFLLGVMQSKARRIIRGRIPSLNS